MKILVIGEICTDKFVYGKIDRLSPEAPVPVFIPLDERTNYGMAGNVVKNIFALNPEIIINSIHNKKLITKTRFVDKKTNHMIMRMDEGENNIDEFKMTDSALKNILDSDAVIISDYNKGFLSDEDIIDIGKLSRITVLDSKRKLSDEIVRAVNFVKLNEKEYQNNIGLNVSKLLITLGERGVMYMGETYPSPSPKETIDVSGAGDTFVASFTYKYLMSDDIVESLYYANQMSAIVVSKKGVTTP